MTEANTAGMKARTDTDEPPSEKPSPYARLAAKERDALVVIAGLDAPNGSEVGAELESYRHNRLNPNTLYPTLDTLVEHGLVEKTQPDGRSNAYTLTPAGHRALNDRQAWTQYYRGDSDE